MIKIGYICNRKKCERCSSECLHTFDEKFAAFPEHLIPEFQEDFEIGSYNKETNELILFEKVEETTTK